MPQAQAVTDAHDLILEAIRLRRRLSFVYNGRLRLVEPQCYGIGTKGTRLLRAHQLQGGAQREPLFDVAKMVDLSMLATTFDGPGPNYSPNDSAMATVLAELDDQR